MTHSQAVVFSYAIRLIISCLLLDSNVFCLAFTNSNYGITSYIIVLLHSFDCLFALPAIIFSFPKTVRFLRFRCAIPLIFLSVSLAGRPRVFRGSIDMQPALPNVLLLRFPTSTPTLQNIPIEPSFAFILYFPFGLYL